MPDKPNVSAPPLDLAAIEVKLQVLDSDPNGVLMLEDERALLAALRAHRAALRPFITEGAKMWIGSELPDDHIPQFSAHSIGEFRRAAAVLAMVRDEAQS